jgi:3-phytase
MDRLPLSPGFVVLVLVIAAAGAVVAQQALTPAGATAAVPHDPDDPAIWIHPTDPARSLIIGTDKAETDGGLYVFALDGSIRQRIVPLDRPNNVDIEYGVGVGDRRIDIAVLTERLQQRLRVFEIPLDGSPLRDLAPGGLPILAGETGQMSEPMGIGLYKRPDQSVFAIVSPKSGLLSGYLWQYMLVFDATGRVATQLVRRFGAFSGDGEIEAIVVDDELGFVYYSDETYGIRKYRADPDAPDAARELAVFGQKTYKGHREGLAIYSTGPRSGFILSSDQVSNSSRVRLYRREGAAGNPHQHVEVKSVLTSADSADGLDATSRPLGEFPRGLLVMMNSKGKNFQLYSMAGVVD